VLPPRKEKEMLEYCKLLNGMCPEKKECPECALAKIVLEYKQNSCLVEKMCNYDGRNEPLVRNWKASY
jgi:hypothetical protein